MKKITCIAIVFVMIIISASLYFLNTANSSNSSGSNDIVFQFKTYNGYGNNLYIDNVLTGVQKDNDVTVTAILNIPYDTSYSTQNSGIDSVIPQLTISNIGRNSLSDTIKVYLDINSRNYYDSVTIIGISFGQTVLVDFPQFYYNIGTPYFLKAYISLSPDSNHVNDTLNQYSIILPGFERNVLYEEFTSNSSPASANNNFFLDTFVNGNIQSIAAIKYHTGLLGTDSFYSANPQQADERRRYYYVSAVPLTLSDGNTVVSIPYSDSSNIYSPFLTRRSIGSPMSISVTDERVAGDSIKATININVISSIPAGDYRLRINAIERYVNRPSQGTNGETDFYDIFRRYYPDSNGISIPVAIGNYQYVYTYYREPIWNDSMLYTTVFVQNDQTKEVINCAKARNSVVQSKKNIPSEISNKADLLNVNYNYGSSYVLENFSDSIQTSLNVEIFESFFPPIGWKVFNRDGNITFKKYTGANGPTLTGISSVIMAFFDYNNIGQKDSMYSKTYYDLVPTDTVRFDYAYAQFSSLNIDSLVVSVSTDGGATFPYEIFRKGGLPLATAPQTTSFFIPQNTTQWRTFSFSLSQIVSISNPEVSVPAKYLLKQNFPNPFNPSTVIEYELPVSSNVQIRIFDVAGRELFLLKNEFQPSGRHHVKFDGKNFASGIYFYQLSTEGFSETKSMVLLK